MDGAVVSESDSNLLALSAPRHHQDLADLHPENIEGGRTTAASSASRFGNVLKISEDGMISFFQKGKCICDIQGISVSWESPATLIMGVRVPGG
jgi:hypothetical protein